MCICNPYKLQVYSVCTPTHSHTLTYTHTHTHTYTYSLTYTHTLSLPLSLSLSLSLSTDRHHVDLVRCPEHPQREGEYVIQVGPSSYKAWLVRGKGAQLQWEWSLKHIRRIHWHKNVNKLEVEPGRWVWLLTLSTRWTQLKIHTSKVDTGFKVSMIIPQSSLGCYI